MMMAELNDQAETNKTRFGWQNITAPKTYAGDIKAFANSRSLRETYFHFCKCIET